MHSVRGKVQNGFLTTVTAPDMALQPEFAHALTKNGSRVRVSHRAIIKTLTTMSLHTISVLHVMTVPVTKFRGKMTLRWDVAPNDYIVWLRWKGDLAIQDFWEMREGDVVSITSSIEDLPPWFELHPTEVCGYAACLTMEKKLKAGYKPTDKTEGPNLWRAATGDRVVWVSGTLPAEDPVKIAVEFQPCAFVFGERRIKPNDLAWFMSFGAPLEDAPTPDAVERMRNGLNAIRALGVRYCQRKSGLSINTVRDVLNGNEVKVSTLATFQRAMKDLNEM